MVSAKNHGLSNHSHFKEATNQYTIHTDSLFDSHAKTFVHNTSITVDRTSGLITKVFERTEDLSLCLKPGDIDLSGLFVMPGFVDAHAHIFLHPYNEKSATEQMRDESLVERVIRATNHVRAALLAGYTTYRDLGTEGLQAADTNFRDAINRGLIPGPRLFVATDPISSTGTYEARTENLLGGTRLPNLTDAADGVDSCRQAVRRRLGLGADVVKVYADYRRRPMRFPGGRDAILFPPSEPNPSIEAYTMEEMVALGSEARRGRCPISAHAQTNEAATMAAEAGFTSVEHCPLASDSTLKAMKSNNTIFVPTLSVFDGMSAFPFADVLASTKRAWSSGVQLACGGDTGAFPGGHGANAKEMELMIKAGVPVKDVMAACMIGGWKSCGGDLCGRRFGYLATGWAADIVGLEADPMQAENAFRTVSFVMKDAKVWKRNGIALGMV